MKKLIIICLAAVGLLFSCQSDDNSENEGDSMQTEIKDSSEFNNNEINAEDIDSISESGSEHKEVIITKYICPLGDKEGNQNEPGECTSCGMELIENPDYTEE